MEEHFEARWQQVLASMDNVPPDAVVASILSVEPQARDRVWRFVGVSPWGGRVPAVVRTGCIECYHAYHDATDLALGHCFVEFPRVRNGRARTTDLWLAVCPRCGCIYWGMLADVLSWARGC